METGSRPRNQKRSKSPVCAWFSESDKNKNKQSRFLCLRAKKRKRNRALFCLFELMNKLLHTAPTSNAFTSWVWCDPFRPDTHTTDEFWRWGKCIFPEGQNGKGLETPDLTDDRKNGGSFGGKQTGWKDGIGWAARSWSPSSVCLVCACASVCTCVCQCVFRVHVK